MIKNLMITKSPGWIVNSVSSVFRRSRKKGKKLYALALFLLVFATNNSVFSQSSGKLYLSSAGTGFVYDITGSTPSTVAAALPAGITAPAYYGNNNGASVSNLAVGYDDTQANRPLVFLNSNTTANSPLLKNGTATGLTLPVGIGGIGTNNVIGQYFGQSFGFSGKSLYRLYPTVSATPMTITGDTMWNASSSTIFASDTFYDYQNNVYTLLQNLSGTTYTRYLYRIAITSATTATATQIAAVSGPVGVRNADANTSTANDVGNVRGTAYLNGYVFLSSGNGNDDIVIYRININTGVSEYLTQYNVANLSSSNIDLASVDYFQPFVFSCGAMALQGNTPYVAGTSSQRTLRIPISNIYTPGTYTINVNGADFTNPTYAANITSSTTFIDVPLTYNGTGQGGYRTLTVDLNGSTTTCSYKAFIDADSDGDGVLDSADLDDDNDGILDSAEGCAATVTMASVSSATATSLSNTNSAVVPLVPPGGASLPGGGVTVTKTSGTGNGWGIYTPPVASTTITVNGAQTSSFSTTYLDIVGTVPRTLNINFGVSANSLSSNNNRYQFIIGIAGLGGENTSVTNTFSVPLTVAANANVFNTGLYSLLDGAVSTTPGVSGTTFTTNTPFSTPQGYTFFLVPVDVSSLTMTLTGNNDPHGIIFGVYNANCTADADSDGIVNRLDLDSDNDGCLDAMEGDENVAYSMLVNAHPGLSVGTGSSAANQNLCNGANCVNANGVPAQVNAGGLADTSGTQGQGIGDSQNASVSGCYCYKPVVTGGGTVLSTLQGITSLGRAGVNNSNWPMVRNGAWTALESKTKGFVINRLTTAQISAIPAANLVEGMMVYNITLDCLQVNTTGTPAGWSCLNTQSCPTN